MQKHQTHGGRFVGQRVERTEPATEPLFDLTVHVDRSVRPTYPDWVKVVMLSELECSGPAIYNLRTAVGQWFPREGEFTCLRGVHIYDQLKNSETLLSCLNLQDGLAIQQKGIEVFRKIFSNKDIYFWGSVVENRNGDLKIPSLSDYGGCLTFRWVWLGCYFSTFSHPVLYFKKQQEVVG